MGIFEESKGRLKQALGYIPLDGKPPNGAQLFLAYSHIDRAYRDQLLGHLSGLQRQGLAVAWSDREIRAGQEWHNTIDQHLEVASVILLLVSSDFIASNYCWDVEIKRALERHAAQSARVVPIILRDCDWKPLPFGRLQAIPDRPVASFADRDAAWAEVAREVRAIVEKPNVA